MEVSNYEREVMLKIMRCLEKELRRCFRETGQGRFEITCTLIKPQIVRVRLEMGTVYTFIMALEAVPVQTQDRRRLLGGRAGLAGRQT